MKTNPLLIAAMTAVATLIPGPEAISQDSKRAANTVILDEAGVRNLGIETVEVQTTDFEETIFAIGRIEVIPARRGVVSSRIPGRVVDLSVFEGDSVETGEVVVKVESRQAGNPPPVIPLKTPISGLVMHSHVSIGEPVSPDTDLLEINDLSEVYAVARIPEDQAGRLKSGTPARISIAALPAESFDGELLRFGTSADRESGTIDAIFHLTGLDGSVRPDMRAEFSIVIERRPNVMAVPKESVQGDALNRFVFVKDFDLPNAFVKARVKTGARNDRYFEIINGVLPVDEIVTKGAYPLAFASGGTISLKEALDAAHGHEHNVDGSELSAADKTRKAAEEAAAAGGSPLLGPLTIFLAILSALLLLLLILSLFARRRPESSAAPTAFPHDA